MVCDQNTGASIAVEIELTDDELMKAYFEWQHITDTEEIKDRIEEMPGRYFNDGVVPYWILDESNISRIAENTRNSLDDNIDELFDDILMYEIEKSLRNRKEGK